MTTLETSRRPHPANVPTADGDPGFAAKLAAFHQADAAFQAKETEIDRQIAALPAEPKIPDLLRQPFSHPTEDDICEPRGGIWTEHRLLAIACGSEIFFPAPSWLHAEPLDSEVRTKAAMLLKVARDYEAARRARNDAVDAIFETGSELYEKRQRLVLDVVMHPANTLRDLGEKAKIARSIEGTGWAIDDEWVEIGDLHKAIIADVIRLAEGER